MFVEFMKRARYLRSVNEAIAALCNESCSWRISLHCHSADGDEQVLRHVIHNGQLPGRVKPGWEVTARGTASDNPQSRSLRRVLALRPVTTVSGTSTDKGIIAVVAVPERYSTGYFRKLWRV